MAAADSVGASSPSSSASAAASPISGAPTGCSTWSSRRAASAARAAIDNLRATARSIRPWLFLGPALLFLTVYLIYPVVETLRLSFLDKHRRELRRLRQLRLGVRRPRVPAIRSSTTSSGCSSCRPPAPSSA